MLPREGERPTAFSRVQPQLRGDSIMRRRNSFSPHEGIAWRGTFSKQARRTREPASQPGMANMGQGLVEPAGLEGGRIPREGSEQPREAPRATRPVARAAAVLSRRDDAESSSALQRVTHDSETVIHALAVSTLSAIHIPTKEKHVTDHPANPSGEHVLIFDAPNQTTAELVCATLQAAGLHAVLLNERAAAASGWLNYLMTWGLGVLVPASEAEAARAVLKEREPTEEEILADMEADGTSIEEAEARVR
jgi:hypothetical protein